MPPAERAAKSPGPLSEINAFKAIDTFLDLGRSGQSRLAAVRELNAAEAPLFLRHLRELVRLGVVGTEVLEVDGEPRQAFVDTAYADPRLRNAPQYRRRPPVHLDMRG
ncbi:MAG: hypothetical protein HYZ00_09930 [Candidatus Hydrogenedentes bacterium]|nr:hypothetical protein [Candidatus Hydrogenedentota bacterium]